MDSTSPSLWLPTAVCLIAWALGMVLHLAWHPHRRHLSDAWDMMTGNPWLIVFLAAIILLSDWARADILSTQPSSALLPHWREILPTLAAQSVETYLRSLHALAPAWPLATACPFVLTLLAWRVMRLPYRYGARKLARAEALILSVTAAAAWGWVALEIFRAFRAMPEWVEAMRLLFRLMISGVTMAMSQVFVIRLAVNWIEPGEVEQQTDAVRAVEEAFARWRSVFALAVLNLLWLAWAQGGSSSRWLNWEAMAVFAPLPVAVASAPGSLLAQGALAMRALLRAFLPWLGIAVTAVAVLMFVHYATAVFQDLAGPASVGSVLLLPLRALVLATVHSWLFLATVFIFLRHGLKPHPVMGGGD